MRILHILDHSIPRHSSYALRTLALLKQQRALGWHTIHLTGPRQGRLDSSSHKLDGWHFFRTVPNGAAWSRIPLLRHVAYVNAMARRLRQVVKLTRPDLLHVHPPALNALAALRVGRSLGVPVVCEIRPSWAEAAIARGASGEDSMRCRASRALETYLARHADAIVTASAGLRADLQARGVPGQRITVIPAAIGIRHVDPDQPFDAGLARPPGMGDGPVIGFIGSFYAH
jgi:glycogen(starch) synthase